MNAGTPRFDTVSFLTDYGTDDEFVGVVKCVLREMAPHVTVVDLTHGIPPFDVRAGALALARSIPYVPEGVVLAVVDPGVGTARRAVAIEVAEGAGVVVGPDNGLLAPAVALAGGAERAVVLNNPVYHLAAPGATFAGRDVFAPAAAHLCNGVELLELGDAIDPGDLLPGMIPLPREEAGAVHAEVLWVDRFGNCQLNISLGELDGWGATVRMKVGENNRALAVASAFGELRAGAPGLVVDSYGMLTVCVDRASAAHELGLGPGDQVELRPFTDEAVTPTATSVQIGRSAHVEQDREGRMRR